MRIYLDNCCFNRPFDDQTQTRIRIEAEAKLFIQAKVRDGVLDLAWSYILDYENDANPFEERRRIVADWKQYAVIDVDETEAVVQQAKTLSRLGIKAKDALHLACAITAGCDCFVTTDDAILRRGNDVRGIRIVEPFTLVREMEL